MQAWQFLDSHNVSLNIRRQVNDFFVGMLIYAQKSLDRHSRPFSEARRVWDFATQLAPSTCQLSALLSVDVARASPVAKEVQENTLSSPKEEFVSDASRDSVS